MPKYLRLPKIGMNMEEGVISEWLIKPGDYVEKEQMVVTAETDKAVQDMFATDSGYVYKLLVQPGDVVPCQGEIAILLDEGEEYVEETPEEAAEAPVEEKKEITASSSAVTRQAIVSGDRIRISPLAKKMAKEKGIDITLISPAEPGKRIVKADVLRYEAEKQNEPVVVMDTDEGTFIPFTRKRAIIGKRMVESVTTKPRVTLQTTVDCTSLIRLRELMKAKQKVTYNEIIAKACSAALKKYPDMNCITEEGGVRVFKKVNIGVAVDTSDGLLVPVLKDVGNRGIFDLAENFRELVEKARDGRLTLDEMTGGTFSISNVGMFGIENFNPIINAPECLILGVGCMKDCVVSVNHASEIRTCMQISLSFDHAVFDGAAAAKLLKEIKDLLEEPMMMLA